MKLWTLTIFGLVVFAIAHLAHADTLICRDGRILRGDVKKTGSYYTVTLKIGGTTLTLQESDVQKWERDAAPTPAKPASTSPKNPPANSPASSTEAKPESPAEKKDETPAEMPAPARPKPESISNPNESLEVLLARGHEALANEHLEIARDAYVAALENHRFNPQAMRGAAAAYCQLRDWDLALPLLRKLYETEKDRAVAINLAAAELAMNDPVASVKVSQDFLEANQKSVDEDILNAMTIALAQIDLAVQQGALQPSLEFHAKCVAQLQSQHTGEKRWGITWLAAADVDKKIAAATEQPEIPGQIEPIAMDDTLVPNAKIAVGTVATGPRSGSTTKKSHRPAAPADDDEVPEKKVRKRSQFAAAFAIAPDLVVTAADPLIGADSAELQMRDGTVLKASIVRMDQNVGLALLKITGNRRLSYLTVGRSFGGGKISATSFPTNNIFEPKAESVAGISPAPFPRMGKKRWTLNLENHPRLPGGPLVCAGEVVGVEMANIDDEPEAIPAITLDELRAFIGDAQSAPSPKDEDPAMVVMQMVAVKKNP